MATTVEMRELARNLNMSLEKDLDLEDVLQCLYSKENGCDILITNDKELF